MEEDPQVSCSMNFISKLAIYKRNEFATKKAQVCICIYIYIYRLNFVHCSVILLSIRRLQ